MQLGPSPVRSSPVSSAGRNGGGGSRRRRLTEGARGVQRPLHHPLRGRSPSPCLRHREDFEGPLPTTSRPSGFDRIADACSLPFRGEIRRLVPQGLAGVERGFGQVMRAGPSPTPLPRRGEGYVRLPPIPAIRRISAGPLPAPQLTSADVRYNSTPGPSRSVRAAPPCPITPSTRAALPPRAALRS